MGETERQTEGEEGGKVKMREDPKEQNVSKNKSKKQKKGGTCYINGVLFDFYMLFFIISPRPPHHH